MVAAPARRYAAAMARTDLLGRLADLSEEAIQRLSDAPGADRVISALNASRDRVDELQRRVRGLEALEQRVEALERRVAKLDPPAELPSRRARKATSTKSSGGTRAKKG